MVVVGEINDFQNNFKKIIQSMMTLLHYGGPHSGPELKPTTELIIALTIEIISYLAKGLENKTISIKIPQKE